MKTTWSSACILSYPGRMSGLWLVSKWQILKEVSLPNWKFDPNICLERVRETTSNCRSGCRISGPAFFDGDLERQRRRQFAFVHFYPAVPTSCSSIAAFSSSSSDPSPLLISPVSPISTSLIFLFFSWGWCIRTLRCGFLCYKPWHYTAVCGYFYAQAVGLHCPQYVDTTVGVDAKVSYFSYNLSRGASN